MAYRIETIQKNNNNKKKYMNEFGLKKKVNRL